MGNNFICFIVFAFLTVLGYGRYPVEYEDTISSLLIVTTILC